MKVLLGVTGGIAAYKAAELIRGLTELGHEVRVLPTQNALRFIGATTLEALSHNVVDSDLYTDVESVKHIELAQWADVIVVAPATASFLARTASGLADDLLGNVILASTGRIVFAPAMHTEMWFNQATEANVSTLKARGVEFVEPGVGRLTGSDSGVGRLADTADILLAITSSGSLSGKKVVVTAGGTREAIDPVRFIANHSSGKQGVAVALAAQRAGAQVTLIAANVDAVPSNLAVVRVTSALELQERLELALEQADVLVMAAAVADYRLAEPSTDKLKRAEIGETLRLSLVANPDILGSVNRPGLFKVGFAAETSDSLEAAAQQKLVNKGCDLVVANDVSNGAVFGEDRNSVLVVDKAGVVAEVAGSKSDVASKLIDIIAARLS
jgi:phosphopantothenoylcysteine decarboxylase/phosphopantothenate--cysteine ligase